MERFYAEWWYKVTSLNKRFLSGSRKVLLFFEDQQAWLSHLKSLLYLWFVSEALRQIGGAAAAELGMNRIPSSSTYIPLVTQLHSNAPLGTDVCANCGTEKMLRKKGHKLTLAVIWLIFSESICETPFFSSQRRWKMWATDKTATGLTEIMPCLVALLCEKKNFFSFFFFLLCLHRNICVFFRECEI